MSAARLSLTEMADLMVAVLARCNGEPAAPVLKQPTKRARKKKAATKATKAPTSRALKRGTKESWSTIRGRIFERDRGICHVCKMSVDPDVYECGHIVDRCAEGTDLDSNLVVMHTTCNRLKPVHSTRAEYEAWVEASPIAQLFADCAASRVRT